VVKPKHASDEAPFYLLKDQAVVPVESRTLPTRST
jgi:hypothetical protein